jgi:ATP-dependent Lon protease, bacterial type
MEVIRIAGYTEQEKMNIAKKFLLTKEMEANGLVADNIEFTKGALLRIIRQYTREAGVRSLEREIASICRKVAKEIVSNGNGTLRKMVISSKNIPKYLGVPKFRHGETEENNQIGLTTGLAWTEVGGELLAIEASIMEGTGRMVMTGKLGDVMQESVQAALTYIRARAEKFGFAEKFLQEMTFTCTCRRGDSQGRPFRRYCHGHFHCIRAYEKKVRADLAMTGEITLRGRVLPIGGLKEKILAAHRGNIKMVVIPKDNEKDLAEVPHNVQNALKIVFVEHIDEVLDIAFVKEEDLFESASILEIPVTAQPVN